MEMKLRRRRSRRGLSLVEAMLVLPLLLLVTFGLIEYGNMLLRLQQVANVSRQAARTASLPDASSAQVINTITTMMNNAGLQNSGYTYSFPSPGSVNKGSPISVTIQITYANISITKAPLIPVPTTIARTVTMAKEGP